MLIVAVLADRGYTMRRKPHGDGTAKEVSDYNQDMKAGKLHKI